MVQVSEAIRGHHADSLQLPSRKFRPPSLRAVSVYRTPLPACVCRAGYPLGKGHPKQIELIEPVEHDANKASFAKEDDG